MEHRSALPTGKRSSHTVALVWLWEHYLNSPDATVIPALMYARQRLERDQDHLDPDLGPGSIGHILQRDPYKKVGKSRRVVRNGDVHLVSPCTGRTSPAINSTRESRD